MLLDLIATGHWDHAAEVGAACTQMARDTGVSQLRYHQLLADLGVLAAGRGDLVAARRYAADVYAWAKPRGLARLLDAADRIALRVALADGDYPAAHAAATRVCEPGKRLGRNLRELVDDRFDLVEASAMNGYLAEAREYVAEVTRLRLAEISPRADALTKAMAAMVNSGIEAGRLYESALNHPGLAGFPLDHARVALAHGRWLRRQRHWSAARTTLDVATGVFARLGAASWADQARAELRAARGSAERSLGAAAALSNQEFQIAELAAAGLTTRTIAARLCLSPRTVDTHLYRLFRKLGITRRSELCGLLPEWKAAVMLPDLGI